RRAGPACACAPTGSSSGMARSSACTSAGCTSSILPGSAASGCSIREFRGRHASAAAAGRTPAQGVGAHRAQDVSLQASGMSGGPQRIVCLTEEPTEVLYALGEQDRIVGISGFTVRPPRARREKPKVSAFTSAKIDAILELRPDFVVGFSDIQADIAAALVRRGVEVWISNHRSVDGIVDYVRRLGALVGVAARADAHADGLRRGLEAIAADAARLPRRPKVYFEEWDEPPITGIQWVAELVRIAGGDDIFPERAIEPLAKGR